MFYYYLLTISAIIPVVALCFFIYKKDVNKEPIGLLAKLFAFGFFSVIPVLVLELLVSWIFSFLLPPEEAQGFILTFINVFLSVAIIEEGFKWIITKFFGYDNQEFDEIYDIIVYSVFVSLGFACVENLLFVLQNGFGNAIMRALLSVPGHACFAVIMGYFFALAKINSINNNKSKVGINLLLSILCPALVHTMYDAILMVMSRVNNAFVFVFLLLFFVFDIIMVVVCFLTVNKISKIQKNVKASVEKGIITADSKGHLEITQQIDIHFCPVCGKPAGENNFCTSCGCKLR